MTEAKVTDPGPVADRDIKLMGHLVSYMAGAFIVVVFPTQLVI